MRRTAFLAALLAASPAGAAPLQPGETLIGGHTYRFDPDVFEGGVVETGRIHDMLLLLAWPEMRGLTPAENAMWPPRPTLLVLANSAAETPGGVAPPDYLLGGVQKELEIAISPRVGEHTVVRPVKQASTAKRPGSGMVELERGKDSPGAGGFDVYALPPLAHTTEFVLCNHVDATFQISLCSQYFVAADMIMKVTYERPIVDHWTDIHSKIVAFLTTHETADGSGR